MGKNGGHERYQSSEFEDLLTAAMMVYVTQHPEMARDMLFRDVARAAATFIAGYGDTAMEKVFRQHFESHLKTQRAVALRSAT